MGTKVYSLIDEIYRIITLFILALASFYIIKYKEIKLMFLIMGIILVIVTFVLILKLFKQLKQNQLYLKKKKTKGNFISSIITSIVFIYISLDYYHQNLKFFWIIIIIMNIIWVVMYILNQCFGYVENEK